MGEIENTEKSKTQIKREKEALKALGQRLLLLSEKALEEVPVSDNLLEALLEAKRMKRSALQRQMRFIAGLLENEDVPAIENALDKIAQPHQQEARVFKQLEAWRDRLMGGDEQLQQELCEQFALLDRQYLRQLLRNAHKEREQNKPPKSARLLFKYLRGLYDA